ncbi:hypothetical protein CEUSTIGMA_g10086.t1 [Chlamydomonas eustigma]|uniref:Protein SDA1 n=1 Tax=Chlamydomonas eustigma TaxID=1157962 RepID=A0A250XIN7_9CHLO|nr:hypothetical protein CEUSTIGMA_g10086.t1 [Chlamydomonas eustigma]|eukprot:GAX82660.1 hypothetical protein CEUSTIGMA_g10086.t1 [Chlamydomonas eustigma]
MTAAYAGADLLALQGNVKRDPDGYKDEFLLQYRHFLALMDLFKLKPSKESKELGDLALFMAQVVKCYPSEMVTFSSLVMELLDTHYAVLDTGLRRMLVQALILMRNRSQLDAMTVMPLFFRLFRCQDKQLRHQLFKHIVSDIKNSNKHHRNEKLNKSLQNFMYGVISDDNEAAAKKSLAVCTELWRRHVWRDARTVNVIASAAFHKSSRIMLAVLKFFLGQDAADEAGSDGEDNEGGRKDWDEEAKSKMPTKEDIYRAHNKGTKSSKKKKERKLARVLQTVKKATRKGQESHSESFAALHLLHDPQTFAEKLFSRMQTGHEKFETRMAMIQVLSRIIGVHKLLVLNFYPYLQKYIAPHQRDVTVILASLVMACHELVPPENLAPVLKQLVDQFVHDKARPEVMTVGLKTVRELCMRTPLVMNETLLQDLAMYRKFREKEVATAARGLIGLFRELNPSMLSKKDRGRGADLDAKPKAYGEVDVRERVDGADLLQAAIAAGQGSEDDEYHLSSGSDSDADVDDGGEDVDEEAEGADKVAVVEQDIEDGDGEEDEGEEDEGEEGEAEDWDSEDMGDSENKDGSDSEDEDRLPASSDKQKEAGKKLDKMDGSLASLKKQLAEAKARKVTAASAGSSPDNGHGDGSTAVASTSGAEGSDSVPIEADRFLTEEDFERIRRLKQKALIESALSKHGLQGASKAKRKRMLEAAEAEATELAELQALRAQANELRVNPDDLKGRHKRRKDKAERMESVLAGREDREKFGSSIGRKKKKTGGLTEREKQKRKAMPIAARVSQLKRRTETTRKLKACKKNFKGHT